MEQPNLTYIDTLANGDEAFKTLLIQIVKDELPSEIEEYKANIKNKSFAVAAENVHKLKHKISILGLEKAYYLAIDFEEELKESMFSQQENFESILDQMSHFVNEL